MVSLQPVQRPQYRMVFGDAIRVYRRKARLTQEKLAERAEMHHNSISEMERGNKECTLGSMVKIAKALGVSVSDLVQGI